MIAETDSIPTVVIRATRWVVIARVIGSLLLGVIAVSAWVLELRSLPIGLGVLALIGLLSSIRASIARVRVSPNGIRFRSKRVPWTDIYQFSVLRRPWVRYAMVDVTGTAGDLSPKAYRLPAPVTSAFFPDPAFDRDVARLRSWVSVKNKAAAAPTQDGFGTNRIGFISIAVFIAIVALFDRPLGWVSGAEASATPSACTTLSGVLSRSVGATDPSEQPTDSATASSCRWSLPGGNPITVTFTRYTRMGLHSGSDLAKRNNTLDRFGIRGGSGTAGALGDRPLSKSEPGVPAQVLVYASGQIEVLDRRANVDIDVQVAAGPLDAATVKALGVTTTAALNAVKVS